MRPGFRDSVIGFCMIAIYVIAACIPATGLVMLGFHLFRRVKYYRRCRHLADQRMQLLRVLLGLAYVHQSNPQLFVKRFYEEVNIGRLECYDVICECLEQRQLEEAQNDLGLKKRDVLLCFLLHKGFTPQELSVIYGMNNYNSIYVRFSRIRKHCRLKMSEETKNHAKKYNYAIQSQIDLS